jgi:hypothetical protein
MLRLRPRGRALARPLTLALAAFAAAFSLATPHAAAAVFSPSSVWNAPLGTNAPLAGSSQSLVAALNRQVAIYKTWINTTTYSTPVYTVPGGQPRVAVKLDTSAPALAKDFAAVPLPADARPAAGSDQQLTVYQPSTDTLWEFWLLTKKADGWHARWGGKMDGVSHNPGYFAAPYGATATSLPLLGGLMRTTELAAHQIDHALAIAVPDVQARTFSWPAQRTDGVSSSSTAIPEGTRFRLPANLNVDALGLSPAVKAMARAAQQYGLVVRDRAGCVAFYAEDPTPSGINPYRSIFGTPWLDSNNALKNFPWSSLQVVAPPARTSAQSGTHATRRR